MPLKAVVRKGDPTTGGGVVLGGAETFVSFGKPVATLGDVATCRIPGHPSTVKIVEASACHQIHGKGMAYDGCMLSCGCRVLATSQVFHIEVEEAPLAPTLHPLTSPEAHPAPAKKEEKAALCAEDTKRASISASNTKSECERLLKKEFIQKHKALFKSISEQLGVNPQIIGAQASVESDWGRSHQPEPNSTYLGS